MKRELWQNHREYICYLVSSWWLLASGQSNMWSKRRQMRKFVHYLSLTASSPWGWNLPCVKFSSAFIFLFLRINLITFTPIHFCSFLVDGKPERWKDRGLFCVPGIWAHGILKQAVMCSDKGSSDSPELSEGSRPAPLYPCPFTLIHGMQCKGISINKFTEFGISGYKWGQSETSP